MLNSRSLFLLGMLAIFSSQYSYADTFTDGGDAYKAGDFTTAAKKFLEVAVKGDHRAMYALGSMYAGGQGVDRDYKKAYLWFSKAAKYGRLDAQYKLGLMYNEGLGVPQNYKRAARLYFKPAKKGYALAQFRLGLLYAKGHAVKQSKVKAYAWLLAAKQNLDKVSRRNMGVSTDIGQEKGNLFNNVDTNLITVELETIKKDATPEELQEAMLLAQEYSQY